MFNTDLHALDEPTEVTEQFIEAVQLFFECIGKLIVEPPLYKFYPNKLYRDFNKSLKVLCMCVSWVWVGEESVCITMGWGSMNDIIAVICLAWQLSATP